MNKYNITYLFFYAAFLTVVITAIFFDKWLLVYVKPIVPLSLIMLYMRSVKKVSFLFPMGMIAVLVADVFIYMDFVKYLGVIALVVNVYYVGCIFLLKNFISKDDIKLHKLASPPVLISVILVAYLVFAITQLALPIIINAIGPVVLIGLGALLFSAANFVIYMADRFKKTIYLFVTACCTLFIDGLIAINELYYYTRIFTILINIAEIVGLYFLTSFFIETKLLNVKSSKEKYF